MRHLHIVADEDHVAAQFWNSKGDLEKNALGHKINTIMPKIIVLYEDVINESDIPWTVVPVDDRWYRDYIISKTMVERLEELGMEYPPLEKED